MNSDLILETFSSSQQQDFSQKTAHKPVLMRKAAHKRSIQHCTTSSKGQNHYKIAVKLLDVVVCTGMHTS